MRSPARLVAGGLALALLASCSDGPNTTSKPSTSTSKSGYVATGKWDAAYVTVIHGLTGSFRSLVVGTPCTEPITEPCVVGGAQISQEGVFATGADSALYEHHAVGLEADATEASGYRTLLLPTGDEYVSAMGRTSRGGCWAPLLKVPEFGSQWAPMPVGFDILLDADAEDDPAIDARAMRFRGAAEVELVLEYLGLRRLYTDAADRDRWRDVRVPIELRVDADGLPAGFAVDGAQVAEALVGPEPAKNGMAPAAVLGTDADRRFDAEVRHTLVPMRGDFTLVGLGTKHEITSPPKARLLTRRARGNDPCPVGR